MNAQIFTQQYLKFAGQLSTEAEMNQIFIRKFGAQIVQNEEWMCYELSISFCPNLVVCVKHNFLHLNLNFYSDDVEKQLHSRFGWKKKKGKISIICIRLTTSFYRNSTYKNAYRTIEKFKTSNQ